MQLHLKVPPFANHGHKFAEIKFEELKSCIERYQLVVIDVRSADEIKDTGKLPGSFNIPRE